MKSLYSQKNDVIRNVVTSFPTNIAIHHTSLGSKPREPNTCTVCVNRHGGACAPALRHVHEDIFRGSSTLPGQTCLRVARLIL